ncbi:MAG: hypothetical protein WCF26_02230 [Candidatus Sulfotelmatobacter sp.]
MRWLLKALLERLLILIALVFASAILPIASVWLVRDPIVGIPVKVNADSGGKPNGIPERR